MKIYTKTGDAGETSLFGGQGVSKAHIRIESYGLADQLNAQLGVANLYIEDPEIKQLVKQVQSQLFNLGADLAAPVDVKSETVVRVDEADIAVLEAEIDRLSEEIPVLKNFILPGGTAAGAHLHLARIICRHVERATVQLSNVEPINLHALIYLNRLSDWLFILARVANHRAGVEDMPWKSPNRRTNKNGE